jgi:hypothetical protein
MSRIKDEVFMWAAIESIRGRERLRRPKRVAEGLLEGRQRAPYRILRRLGPLNDAELRRLVDNRGLFPQTSNAAEHLECRANDGRWSG